MDHIEENFTRVRQLITAAEHCYGRQPGSVRLLAVTKGHSVEDIRIAVEHAGQRDFGESFIQEALVKIRALADSPLSWHFIGPIQSNKTRDIAQHFDWVHSVDRLKIARRLDGQRPSDKPPLNICIQVNASGEPTKSGVTVEEVLPLAKAILQMPRLHLRGLMAIPAPQGALQKQRDSFRQIRELQDRLGEHGCLLDTLSMGMSGDMAAAIAEGATIVRIGTALFGDR